MRVLYKLANGKTTEKGVNPRQYGLMRLHSVDMNAIIIYKRKHLFFKVDLSQKNE